MPGTGDFGDGLGNRISMLAYANPPNIAEERQRGDGYGLVRFDKQSRRITFECWPRFAKVADGNKAQFPGWPITIAMTDNDGRKPAAWLPELIFSDADSAVVQVVSDQTAEVLYTLRVRGKRFEPPVFGPGAYTIRVGHNRPDRLQFQGRQAGPRGTAPPVTMQLGNAAS